MLGSRIGHYSIHERLGEGGMGVVYKATDERLGRSVALKTIPQEAAGDETRKRRFIQEARAASALNHPNIVTIYDAGEENGTSFIAMELVAGRTLDQVIGGKSLPLRETLKYAGQIADALSRACGRDRSP